MILNEYNSHLDWRVFLWGMGRRQDAEDAKVTQRTQKEDKKKFRKTQSKFGLTQVSKALVSFGIFLNSFAPFA
jgi:hypothetical protein